MIKENARVLGIDDGYFKKKEKKTILIGIIQRMNERIEGSLSTEIKIDGLDSTEKIIKMIKGTRFEEQIKAIFLFGVNFAGFNIVDVEKLFKKLKKPVIIISEKKPGKDKIFKALKNFKDYNKRKKLIEKAGEIKKFKNNYFQFHGLSEKEARNLIKKNLKYADIPECLRIAHIIASGITKKESTKR